MTKLMFLIVISVMVFMISCSEEQPTQLSPKYDKNNIQNDTNWVEITDTSNVKLLCIDLMKVQSGRVIYSPQDYKDIWTESLQMINDWTHLKGKDSSYQICKDYKDIDFDYANRSLMGYFTVTGIAETKREIYVNNVTNTYLHLVKITVISNLQRGDCYYKWVSVPKIKDGYKVMFDTTLTYDIR